MNLFENNGATFSNCRTYRYALWRIWDQSKPLVMFIGLNPSTANEEEPDPTITRAKGFAHSWGYGGFYMMNLYAYVSTNPDELITCTDNTLNDSYLYTMRKVCKDVVFAWGNFKVAVARSKEIIKMFPDGHCLVKNKNGSPRHPLYVKGDVELIKYVV